MTSKHYNRIKEVLSQKKLTQTWLAEKLGKTFRQVNAYVTNTVQPSIPVLYEIANILDVTPQELLVDDNNSMTIAAEEAVSYGKK